MYLYYIYIQFTSRYKLSIIPVRTHITLFVRTVRPSECERRSNHAETTSIWRTFRFQRYCSSVGDAIEHRAISQRQALTLPRLFVTQTSDSAHVIYFPGCWTKARTFLCVFFGVDCFILSTCFDIEWRIIAGIQYWILAR